MFFGWRIEATDTSSIIEMSVLIAVIVLLILGGACVLSGTLCFNGYAFIFLSTVFAHSSLHPKLLLPIFSLSLVY